MEWPGLTTLSEVWSGGVKQKWTMTAWTQDNTSVGYEMNPPRYAWKAFHETLHLGKRGSYSDEDLARAGHAVDETKPPNYKKSDILNWSKELDEVLKRHCAYPSK